MSRKTIAIPDDMYDRVQETAAQEGTTVENIACRALERDLARRWLERIGREAQVRRGSMTDDEVEQLVQKAIEEARTGS